MVVKMMKWSPWPPAAKRFEVKVKILRLEGLEGIVGEKEERKKKIAVEMRWKGPKAGLVSLRRRERRNVTSEGRFVGEDEAGIVEFGDEFENVCGFSASAQKENSFNAWDVSFSILYGEGGPEQQQQQQGSKLVGVGTVSLNLGELASQMQKGETESHHLQRNLSFPPLQIAGVASEATLSLYVSFMEIRTSQDAPEALQQPNHLHNNSNNDDGNSNSDNNVSDNSNSMPESFLRRMTSYVSPYGRAKKKKKMVGPDQQQPGESSDGRLSGRSSAGETTDESAFDTEDGPDDDASSDLPQQLSYGSIASAAVAVSRHESAVYYRHENVGEEPGLVTRSESARSLLTRSGSPPKGGRFLSWKRRRLSFRTGKRKDEPLLNKANGEDGGDDIDLARRQLGSTSDESRSLIKGANEKTVESHFGDEDFAVGRWEEKELISRDGQSKLKAGVFFASIDQRSESAAGESACTVLVAVIADWLQANQGTMPTKSEFDSLIRDGSSEWRKLCDNETYRDRFPDKHFDLDTVIEAEIRTISVAPGKSFVGFFRPESFEFLQGAMSFDSIWDEICSNLEDGRPRIYIVSWNDHFFILKVDANAYYIIDTLGERLFEGCNQAYILKFDDTTLMSGVPEKTTSDGGKDITKDEENETTGSAEGGGNAGSVGDGDQVLCSGRECCREFIKRFLASIPLREMEAEVSKGMVCGVSLHQRLQIELHYTMTSVPSSCPSSRTTVSMVDANDV